MYKIVILKIKKCFLILFILTEDNIPMDIDFPMDIDSGKCRLYPVGKMI